MSEQPTSACSPGSEGSTSPSKPSASDASGRSSGMPPAPESLSDGGSTYRGGEMSEGSLLLPTPRALDATGVRGVTPNRSDEANARAGLTLSDLISFRGGEMLLPTPKANEWKGAGHGEVGRHDFEDKRNLKSIHVLTSSAEASPASPSPTLASARDKPTIAGSGPSSPVSLASWDPDTSSWRTFQVSLLSTEDERFPRSWETWPRSGMTQGGRAYALPMSGLATDGSGSSSLLGTPTTMVPTRRTTTRRQYLPAQIKYLNVPTPTASDSSERVSDKDRGGPNNPDNYETNHNISLVMWARALLPTPRTSDTNGAGEHGDGGPDLRSALRFLGDRTSAPSEDGSE